MSRWADLKNRRERDETGLFLAEGRKLVDEVRSAGWFIEALLAAEGTAEADEGYALTGEQLERVQPEVVVHSAAHGGYSWQADIARMSATNITATYYLIEAARMDGCGELSIDARSVLPLLKPRSLLRI